MPSGHPAPQSLKLAQGHSIHAHIKYFANKIPVNTCNILTADVRSRLSQSKKAPDRDDIVSCSFAFRRLKGPLQHSIPAPRRPTVSDTLLLLALATENAELRARLAEVQEQCIELAVDAGELHVKVEALRQELAEMRVSREQAIENRTHGRDAHA